MTDVYRSISFIYFYRMYARKAHTMCSDLQGVSVMPRCVGNQFSDAFLAFLC